MVQAKSKLRRFRDDVQKYLDGKKFVRDRIQAEGQALVQMMAGPYADMTITDLAKKAKISKAYLSSISTGRISISPDVYLRLWKIHDGGYCSKRKSTSNVKQRRKTRVRPKP